MLLPPGWNGMYCVTSYTLLLIMSQQSLVLSCVAMAVALRALLAGGVAGVGAVFCIVTVTDAVRVFPALSDAFAEIV